MHWNIGTWHETEKERACKLQMAYSPSKKWRNTNYACTFVTGDLRIWRVYLKKEDQILRQDAKWCTPHSYSSTQPSIHTYMHAYIQIHSDTFHRTVRLFNLQLIFCISQTNSNSRLEKIQVIRFRKENSGNCYFNWLFNDAASIETM